MNVNLVLTQVDDMGCNPQSNIHCCFFAKQLCALHFNLAMSLVCTRHSSMQHGSSK